MIAERSFHNEKELEDAIAAQVAEVVRLYGVKPVLIRGFGLDLAVFTSFGVKLFEIKAFASHHGRCGFGNQRGEGNQIRLLFDGIRGAPRPEADMSLLDCSIRWILGDSSKPIGTSRYVIFTCAQAQSAAAGQGVSPGKQNNLRLSAFSKKWISWEDLAMEMKSFLISKREA